ncbi:3-keto-disaccharide hydrolase [Lignipirellula cremea]|uniref:3-keto-alpha-glucoside-1,2-lyase/3-keto-2-hydroxy-glucal hydratase domain-containing protein n=1 Tax=Lignipirellula cremea TaxID=2528010 RepID=A0A518E021_9BACT|nr:DUF1080 domain-containing protein [Lignipirellula cremea]QDU97433.1 hypothetical protein Pla8534_52810 [Lignipirellula cremea]
MKRFVRVLPVLVSICVMPGAGAYAGEPAAISPAEVIRPFNGKDLSGFDLFLKETGSEDPTGIFRVTDGVIHISGEGAGYLATRQAYRDYHLSVEYKWGKHHTGKYVRNSGVLLHKNNVDHVWPTSIEVQLAQGCEGDFIVIGGKTASGEPSGATLTSDTRIAEDKKTRYQPGGTPTQYKGRQFWWSQHQPGFKELLDTRGADDVASPLGEWTRVECICSGDRITIKINGHVVNECYQVHPSSGRILLQNEGSEVYFRNLEIRPLKEKTE